MFGAMACWDLARRREFVQGRQLMIDVLPAGTVMAAAPSGPDNVRPQKSKLTRHSHLTQ